MLQKMVFKKSIFLIFVHLVNPFLMGSEYVFDNDNTEKELLYEKFCITIQHALEDLKELPYVLPNKPLSIALEADKALQPMLSFISQYNREKKMLPLVDEVAEKLPEIFCLQDKVHAAYYISLMKYFYQFEVRLRDNNKTVAHAFARYIAKDFFNKAHDYFTLDEKQCLKKTTMRPFFDLYTHAKGDIRDELLCVIADNRKEEIRSLDHLKRREVRIVKTVKGTGFFSFDLKKVYLSTFIPKLTSSVLFESGPDELIQKAMVSHKGDLLGVLINFTDLKVKNLKTNEDILNIHNHTENISCMGFSHNNIYFAYNVDCKIYIYNLQKKKYMGSFFISYKPEKIVFSQDNEAMFLYSSPYGIGIANVNQVKQLHYYFDDFGIIKNLYFADHDKRMCVYNDTGRAEYFKSYAVFASCWNNFIGNQNLNDLSLEEILAKICLFNQQYWG